jgi:hypothetical protein
MSENLQTGSSEALSIEKLPVHISADKDRKRFSGARGKGIQTSKCTQLFMRLEFLFVICTAVALVHAPRV